MNLVFTSAGDNTDFDELWLDPVRKYKVWVVYYGDDDKVYEKYKSKVDYIERRKGSKFQNFNHIWKTKDLSEFERFFILDDDILIDTSQINSMFKLSLSCNFSICSPSFDEKSKISWKITKSVKGSVFRFTNWVEVNVPLFNKEALKNLMDIYDDSLIGWGVDYLYMYVNNPEKRQKFAIVDSIKCTNPRDIRKGGQRELKKVKDWDKRQKTWEEFRDKHGIEEVKEKKTWWELVNSGTGKNIFQKMPKVQPPRKQFFSSKLNFVKSDTPKIAYLFLTIGDLHKPKFWYDFLKEGEDKCNIYVHSKHRDKLGTGFIRDNQIEKQFDTFWGGPGLVLSTIALLKEALKDPSNKYFVLVSESCIPLYDFDYIYNKLLSHDLSMVHHTKSKFPNYGEWIQSLINKDSPIKRLNKCSQWMGLNRKHAELVAEKGYECFDKSMQRVPIPDEWYIRSLLTQFDTNYNILNEHFTKITERAFVKGASHPITHKHVNLSDYKKREGLHPLFLRKVNNSTKIN
tara:strand:- start:9191 stop:10732 length:1542 start_codon:yes stop_codon:yes gene_type:complete